jgi:rubrerythrin
MNRKSNSLHLKKLEEKGIVIEEIYKCPKENKIFTRTTDGKKNDSVSKSHKIEKNFYKNGRKIFTEKNFDHDTYYTINTIKGEENHTCSECGYTGNLKEFYSGCPYCGANFNIEYTRNNSYGRSLKKLFSLKWVKRLCFTIPVIVSLISIYLSQDVLTIYISIVTIPTLMSLTYILIMIFYTLIAIYRLIAYKDVLTSIIYYNKQEINSAKLIKDVQITLLNDYYDKELYPEYKDLVDFDILDFENYKYRYKNNKQFIVLRIKIRKYFNKGNKIKRIISKEHIYVSMNPNYAEKRQNIRKCPSCGANVPPLKKMCLYCKTPLPTTMLWIVEKS